MMFHYLLALRQLSHFSHYLSYYFICSLCRSQNTLPLIHYCLLNYNYFLSRYFLLVLLPPLPSLPLPLPHLLILYYFHFYYLHFFHHYFLFHYFHHFIQFHYFLHYFFQFHYFYYYFVCLHFHHHLLHYLHFRTEKRWEEGRIFCRFNFFPFRPLQSIFILLLSNLRDCNNLNKIQTPLN